MGIELLISGVVKSEHFYWENGKSTLQSIRDKLRDIGLETWIKYHHVLQRVEGKAYKRLGHPYRTAIRFLAEPLRDFRCFNSVYGLSNVYIAG